MKPRVGANLCRMLWSDLLWRGASMLVVAAAWMAERSVAEATRARMEREEWWRAGYTWTMGALTRR